MERLWLFQFLPIFAITKHACKCYDSRRRSHGASLSIKTSVLKKMDVYLTNIES